MIAIDEHRQAANGLDVIPPFVSVKSTMTRKRAKLIPAISANVHDVEIVGDWAETWRGENLFMYRNNDLGVLCFATEK